MDNVIFNVNGKGRELLIAVLDVAFKQTGHRPVAFKVDPLRGVILYWYVSDSAKPENRPSKLLGKPGTGALAEMIETEMQSMKWEKLPFEDWDRDCDHDGHNSLGWRVYCENWGHVGGDSSAFLCVRPAWLWHGK